MNALKLAYLSVTRRKIQSVIAIISIAISVACAGTLLRLYALSNSRFSTLGVGGDAIVGAKAGGIEILLNSLNAEGEYPQFLPEALFKTLREKSNVRFEDGSQSESNFIESIIPVLFFAKYDGKQSYRVLGTDKSFFQRPEPKDNLTFESGGLPTQEGEVVLGADIARNENLKIGDSVDVTPWSMLEPIGGNVSLRVVGILREAKNTWDRTLYTNLNQAQMVLAMQDITQSSIWGAHVLNYFFVYLKPGAFIQLENLINKRTVGQVVSVNKTLEQLRELTSSGESLGIFIIVFIIILGGLSTMSMLVARFESMTIQIAVLRAIGYDKKEIALWLLYEGLLLGSVACVLGAGLDFLFFPILKRLLGSAIPLAENISLLMSAPVWGAAILATILAILVPLYRVSRQDIHHSLRGL